MSEFPDAGEVEETGRTFAENAHLKALGYARATNLWCLADDSGLEVDALGGEPGVHSARYAAADAGPAATRRQIDEANIRRLLRELADVPPQRRAARFVCRLALAGEGRILLEAAGTLEGCIIDSRAGDNGFGYDPVFFLPERNCTVAQLTDEQKNRISHRGQAVRQFKHRLEEFLRRDA